MATKYKSVGNFLFCKKITIPYCVSKRVDSSSKFKKTKTNICGKVAKG